MPPPSLRLDEALLVRHLFEGSLDGDPSPFVAVPNAVAFRFARRGQADDDRTGRDLFGIGLVSTVAPFDLDLHLLPFAFPVRQAIPDRVRSLELLGVHENRLLLALLDPKPNDRSTLVLLSFDFTRRRFEQIERCGDAPGYRVVRALEDDAEPEGESLDATSIGVREVGGRLVFELNALKAGAPGEFEAWSIVSPTGSLRITQGAPPHHNTGGEITRIEGFEASLRTLGTARDLISGAGALALPGMLAVGGRLVAPASMRAVVCLLRSPPLFEVTGQTIGGPPEYFEVNAREILTGRRFHGEGILSYSNSLPSTFDAGETWTDGTRISDADYPALVDAIEGFLDWMFSGQWEMTARGRRRRGTPQQP